MSYFYPNKLPTEGDLVYTRVIKIEPAYSLVSLLEYNNIHGMIIHTQLSGKKIYGNLSKYIQVNQKLVLEVLKVDGHNIDLTNRNTSDKQVFMTAYKDAHSLHMASQYIASKMGMDFGRFLEIIIYPLYGEQSAYQVLSDHDFRNKWIRERIDDPDICLYNLNKLLAPKLIKPDPIILSLICYESDGVHRLKKFGLDIELELEHEGICIRFERIGDRYSIVIDERNLSAERYQIIKDTIRTTLERLISGTGITMNLPTPL
jgi:translation initiation factor 2 alpha subunit (eIF-2alpha)